MINLDQRKRTLVNALLRGDRFRSSSELAALVGVASRTVRLDLKHINLTISKLGGSLESSPGQGYRIPEECRGLIRAAIDSETALPVTPDERFYDIVGRLLSSPIAYVELLGRLNVSESTLDRDLDRAAAWFRGRNLVLTRRNELLQIIGERELLRRAGVAYNLELAQSRSVPVPRILGERFPQYGHTREILDRESGNFRPGLSDNEYYCLLIYLLLSPGDCSVRDAASMLRIPGAAPESWRGFRENIRGAVDDVLVEFTGYPADEPLVDGIGRSCYPSICSELLPAGDESELQHVEKLYPEALRFAVRLHRRLDENFRPEERPRALEGTALCYAAFQERSIIKVRKRAAVVCGADEGGAQLLAARLLRLFPNIELTGIYPESRLAEAVPAEPDFLITDTELESNLPTVRVGRFLDDDDFDRIVSILRVNDSGKRIFTDLCSKDDFHIDLDFSEPEQLIRFLCRSALGEQAASFEKAVIERERMGTTFIGNLTALPHAVGGEAGRSFISIGILRKPLRWGGGDVQLVMLVKLDENTDIPALFEYIYSIVSNRKLVKGIIREKEYECLSRIL